MLNDVEAVDELLNEGKVRVVPKVVGGQKRDYIRTAFLVLGDFLGPGAPVQFVEEPLFAALEERLVFLRRVLRWSLVNFLMANF